MIQGMLWMTSIYGLTMILVHTVHYWSTRKRKHHEVKHVVLVSNQTQLHIEWYIRSLLFMFWFRGQPFQLSVIDEGSTDQTLDIVRKCTSQGRVDIQVLTTLHDREACEELLSRENIIVIHLKNTHDARAFLPSSF